MILPDDTIRLADPPCRILVLTSRPVEMHLLVEILNSQGHTCFALPTLLGGEAGPARLLRHDLIRQKQIDAIIYLPLFSESRADRLAEFLFDLNSERQWIGNRSVPAVHVIIDAFVDSAVRGAIQEANANLFSDCSLRGIHAFGLKLCE